MTIGGDAKVLRTTISNNQGDDNGAAAGVENESGQTALIESTIAANDGIYIGGISIQGGAVSLTNSTASGNTGFLVANIEAAQGSLLSLVNSTVVNTLTGASSRLFGAPSMFFYSGSNGSVSNSILSSSGGAVNCMGAAPLLSLGHNLSSDNTCGLSQPTDMNNNASVNLGPLQPDNYTVLEGQVLNVNVLQGVLANDTDPDGDALTAVTQTAPSHGTLHLGASGSFIYFPDPEFHGTDTFTYIASDGLSTSPPTLVTIIVRPSFGTITIALSTQPQSSSAFSFNSSLGNFALGGSFPSSKTFEVSAGTWSITELRPRPWLLSNIVCNAGPGVFIDLNKNDLQLVLNDGAAMSCTFVNQLPGQISARSYVDLNADGQRESGEPWLRGWTMQLFLNPTVPVGTGVTGSNGTVWFPNLQAQIYTVCEVPPAGWHSTNPPEINPMYGKPCFTVNLSPSQSLPVLFGDEK